MDDVVVGFGLGKLLWMENIDAFGLGIEEESGVDEESFLTIVKLFIAVSRRSV